MTKILRNCLIFDGLSETLRDGHDILIEDGKIAAISERPIVSAVAHSHDMGGRFVMPGLIDAHFHAYGVALSVSAIDSMPTSLRALTARKILEDSLQRGFTTLRDAAGGDISLALGVERGLIKGPRFFFPGLAVSQTGGHGDMRAPDHEPMCGCAYCGALSIIADGADEMRKVVREQLRRGATHIKLFISGGVFSPSDPIWMNQFHESEIEAAVYEARSRRTYVMAHAHTAEAAIRCVRNGVRSIEHATIMTPESAAEIKAHDAYAVPTLAIMEGLKLHGPALGIPKNTMDKITEIETHALASIELLHKAGVKIGHGSDLLGKLMDRQSREFMLRREVLSPFEILKSATSINAELMMMAGKLGVVAEGAFADLIAIDGNPLDDLAILEQHDKIQLIMKGGEIFKDTI
ncbi:metal-dependent hydrolase family protein [Govanella unica]|uniref:Amidohydrolase family protein n=1 Tax=Govanella unica TaxID=2975056 RepID=A0A9X3Z690_9PROT|nr:amidohydrolase family protein [Govania unica]MDA5192827.1 amidohydrolase family protein [Govania unica]